MNINIKDVLTLDNNKKYIVMSIINYDNKNYLYLSNIDNIEDILFCYLDNDEVVISSNEELNAKLLPLFYENMKNNQ